MKNTSRILAALVFYTGTVFSQGGGTSFIAGFPQGGFKENVDTRAYGGSIFVVFDEPTREYPFVPGISLSLINYGKTESGYFNDEVMYNLAAYHFIFQIFPEAGRGGNISPYIEILLGGISTFANSVDIRDWAWSLGGGAGLMFKLTSHDEWGNPADLWLDIKCRYLYGTSLEYACESAADLENGIFYPAQSSLDMLLFNIGFTSYF